jgi:hypothetical protein
MDPKAYLRHMLERIVDYPVNRIDKQPPGNAKLAPRVDGRAAA